MPSVAEVRKNLLQHELEQDETPVDSYDNGPTDFVVLGMEIEDEKCVSFYLTKSSSLLTTP